MFRFRCGFGMWLAAVATLTCTNSLKAIEPAEAENAAVPSFAPDIYNSIRMRFVYVQPGEFLRGSPVDDTEADDDERPQRRVDIAHSLWVSKFETKQGEFQTVMGYNPSWFSSTGGGSAAVGPATGHLPVDMTTWEEAEEFCRRLGQSPRERAEGRTYRLLTEAEWEYCCRAGGTTRYSVGDTLTAAQACILDPRSQEPPRPREVGSYPPNAFGLHDMHGNVWEWCADRYDPAAYRQEPGSAASLSELDGARVVRGGDYRFTAKMARSANRDFTRATRRDQGNGFRVVLVIDSSAAAR